MTNRRKIVAYMSILAGALFGAGSCLIYAFTTVDKHTVSASVTVGGGPPTGVSLSIQAGTLPAQAFFGKNVVIPVQVTSRAGAIKPANLRVDIVYQLLDPAGNSLNAPTSVPIQFTQSPVNQNVLNGTAIISRSDLSAIQNGGVLSYIFRARQGGSDTVLGSAGISQVPSGSSALSNPFQTSIIDRFCAPVGPAGARVSAPDLSSNDGRTSVQLAPGAITAPDILCIRVEDVGRWPKGPGGSRAAAIYSITLENSTLAGTAQLVLSYPADASGKVLDQTAEPTGFGIYWLEENALSQANGQWLPLSRATIDTTLHTVTGLTSHFSIFALFAAGAIGTADLRPAQRIITPNNDGRNDYAIFGGGVDLIKIFDVRGRRVREINTPSAACAGSLCWDGRDDDGDVVESGVYLYQYTSQGDRVSGVIGVAK